MTNPALDLYRAMDSRLGEANMLKAIGDVQRSRGELEAAQASYSEALDLFRAAGERVGEANTLAAQSRLWLERDPAASQAALEAALTLRQLIGDVYSAAADLGNYGIALVQRGRGAEALSYLQRARAVFVERGLEVQVQRMDQLIAQAQGEPAPGVMEQFLPLLQVIAAVAQGADAPRAEVEATLARFEQRGYHLTSAAQAIWAGQRDPAVLAAGLDATDTALVQRVLALLSCEGVQG